MSVVGLLVIKPILRWVNLVIFTMRRPLPVYSDKQTFSASIGMSQRCRYCCKSLFGVANESS